MKAETQGAAAHAASSSAGQASSNDQKSAGNLNLKPNAQPFAPTDAGAKPFVPKGALNAGNANTPPAATAPPSAAPSGNSSGGGGRGAGGRHHHHHQHHIRGAQQQHGQLQGQQQGRGGGARRPPSATPPADTAAAAGNSRTAPSMGSNVGGAPPFVPRAMASGAGRGGRASPGHAAPIWDPRSQAAAAAAAAAANAGMAIPFPAPIPMPFGPAAAPPMLAAPMVFPHPMQGSDMRGGRGGKGGRMGGDGGGRGAGKGGRGGAVENARASLVGGPMGGPAGMGGGAAAVGAVGGNMAAGMGAMGTTVGGRGGGMGMGAAGGKGAAGGRGGGAAYGGYGGTSPVPVWQQQSQQQHSQQQQLQQSGGQFGMGGGLGGSAGQRHAAAVAAAVAATPPGPGLRAQQLSHLQGATHRPHEPHMAGPGRMNLMGGRFASDALRQQMSANAYAVQAQWPSDPIELELAGWTGCGTLPPRIANYHTLYPLEEIDGVTSSGFEGSALGSGGTFSAALGLRTIALKGISVQDGQPYMLRRIDGRQVVASMDVLASARQAVDVWAPLAHHPAIVGLRRAFVTSDYDPQAQPALCFAYDFHPGHVSLAAHHLTPTMGPNAMMMGSVQPVPEATLWRYVVQLAGALRAVHSAGLALRPACLHPTKVLVDPSTGRVHVTSVGLVDAIAGDPTLVAEHAEDGAHQAHRADLSALGGLLLSLACASHVAAGHQPSMDLLANTGMGGAGPGGRYSPEFVRLLGALLAAGEGGPLGSARQLASALAERSMAECEVQAASQDFHMAELAKEIENGRLLRILVKLGFINERPGKDVDGNWSETGDRYLLKLFRDFVFHQSAPPGHEAEGGPLMDWGHVIEALHKLDAGALERIMLLTRDESSMLVASYGDLKRCVESSYADLQGQTAAAAARNRAMGASL